MIRSSAPASAATAPGAPDDGGSLDRTVTDVRDAAARPASDAEGAPSGGRIMGVRGSDAAAVAREVLAVRERGDIPLVGDDRWSDEHWAGVLERAEAAGALPGIAWATLTSGSTGSPRIVLRSAASWQASFDAVSALVGLGPDDVLALSSPPASSLTLFSVAHAAASGFSLALPTGHTLTAADLTDATVYHGTPHAFRALLDLRDSPAPAAPGRAGEVGAAPVSSGNADTVGAAPKLRAALIGGAELDPALRARAERQGIRVVSYYGAAELSFVAVDTGSGLRAFPGVDLAVHAGELWVRSPYVAHGYLGTDGPLRHAPTPGAPATSGSPAADSWSTVGDRAALDGGRLVLLGRADDAILTAAATVIPAEVERVLRSLPGVRDAVVFGTPNPGIGALVTAVLEFDPAPAPAPADARGERAKSAPFPADTAEADGSLPILRAHSAGGRRSELRAEAAQLLAPTHLPRRWFAVETMPRTPSGKPARAELARRVAAGEVARLD